MNHIIALSGGKDSTAMALRLCEVEPRDYKLVCTPTKNEGPEMEAFWAHLEVLLQRPLLRLESGHTLMSLIEFFEALPSNHQRWCTRMLKIQPYQKWIGQQTPATSYVGLRADEDREGIIYDEVSGITQNYPMQRWGWGLGDVLAYLKEKGVTVPKRTDCLWCYDQRLTEWYALWRDRPDVWAEGERMEAWVSEKRGKPCSFRNPSRDTWPASMSGLRAEFERGRVPRGLKQADDPTRCRVCRM